MLVLLWTQPRSFGFALSNVGSTSDTTSLFWLFLVLFWFYFGHCLALLALPCPMLVLLWTRPRSFGYSLSDVGSTSDTTSLFWLCHVRCWYYVKKTDKI